MKDDPAWAIAVERHDVTEQLDETITVYRRGVSQGTMDVSIRDLSRDGRTGEWATLEAASIEVMAAYDADLDENDTFSFDGHEWEVVSVPVQTTDSTALLARAERRG